MLEIIANALRAPSARLIEGCCGYYQNNKDEWGAYMTVWDAGHYHMISVSNGSNTPTKHEVAAALAWPPRYMKEEGRSRNSRGTSGSRAPARQEKHGYR